MKKENLVRGTIFNLVVYGLIYNSVFYFLKPEIYENSIYLAYILILYITGSIDAYMRPLDREHKEESNFVKFIVLLFLLNPFLLVLAVMENEWIFGELNTIISIIGLILYFSAGMMVLASRKGLGKQGTGTLVIVADHELITTGIYRYIRHPMYAGSLLGGIAFILVAQAIIVGVISFIIYFVVFNDRVRHEEKILIGEFGEKYEEYMKTSKKFIPFIF